MTGVLVPGKFLDDLAIDARYGRSEPRDRNLKFHAAHGYGAFRRAAEMSNRSTPRLLDKGTVGRYGLNNAIFVESKDTQAERVGTDRSNLYFNLRRRDWFVLLTSLEVAR